MQFGFSPGKGTTDAIFIVRQGQENLLGKLKEKGLRVNTGKTKVMNCKVRVGQVENSGKYPCGICRSGVGDNAIRCTSCKKWIHKRCSRVVGRLAKIAKVGDFKCRNCSG